MALTWSTACPDWEERIVERRSLLPCPPLFPEEAEAALQQFRGFRIVDAAGSPTIEESCADWFFDLPRAVFGAYDPDTGRRLIRYFYLHVSKKNAKSLSAAAIMLTALLRNWRESAEFLIVAPTIEVAGNSFAPARDMIRVDDELREILEVRDYQRTITHRQTRATLRIVAADNETVSGKKASGVLVDELWLFGRRANAENMLREATGGLASRPEGFIIYLSTQSDSPPAGVFASTLKQFRDIRDGKVVDPRSLGIMYEFPEHMVRDQAYRDPAWFYVTNPNLGRSVDMEFLLDESRKADHAGEASYRGFASKHLNVEIGLALRSDSWAGAAYWDRGAMPGLTLSDLIEMSDVLTVGIDGGGLDDLLGVSVMGRERGTRRWLAWCHAFVSPEGEERKRGNSSVYADFKSDGDLTLVEELPDDLDGVVAIVKSVKDSGKLYKVGADPRGIGGIIDALSAIDVSERHGNLTGVMQGIALMGAFKAIERKLVDGSFKHDGSRMMTWCVGNARIVPMPTATRIARDESGMGKIDPLMALFNAAELMATNPAAVDISSMIG